MAFDQLITQFNLPSDGSTVSAAATGEVRIVVSGTWANPGSSLGTDVDAAGYYDASNRSGTIRARMNGSDLFDSASFAGDRSYETIVTVDNPSFSIYDSSYIGNSGALLVSVYGDSSGDGSGVGDDSGCCQSNKQAIANLKQELAQLKATVAQKPDRNVIKSIASQWALGEGLSQISDGVIESNGFAPAVVAVAGTAAATIQALKQDLGGQITRLDNLLGSTSQKASTAITKVNAVDKKVAEGFTNVVKRGEFKQVINATTTKVQNGTAIANKALKQSGSALTTAGKASTAAAAAGATATGALGKITSFLTALGAVGGVAGLIALFGFFKATRPQLNANEKRLDSLDKAASDALSKIQQNRNIARNAQSAADEAQKDADRAEALAKDADRDAGEALGKAGKAQTTANSAFTNSKEALKRTNRNSERITALEKRPNPVNPQDVEKLKRQNDTAINQNSRLIRLVENLPTNPNTDFKLPPELIGLPLAVSGLKRTTDSIARNTTAAAQKANSKAGTCEAFAPSQCGDKAISRNTRPLRKKLDEILDRLNKFNVAINTAISTKLDRLIQITLKFQNKTFRKFDETWKFLRMDRVLNLISTAASIHNAAMLSRNMAESLVFAVDGIFAMVGLRDAEGNPFSFSSQISGGIRAIINRTIGADAARGLSERWNRWNRIISAGAAVVMSVRSVQWAIAEGVEIIGDWVAKIGNGLRDHGSVSDRQWPWMKEGIKIKQFSAVERFNDGLENAETIVNQIYGTVSAGAEIAESVNAVRASKQQFDATLEQERIEVDDQLTQDNLESEAPDIEPIDLVRIEEVEE